MANEIERLRAALTDRYQLERELGAGGMATVYLAHDRKHDRRVALKVLKPELAVALGTDRFLREVTITARLSHPHVLPLLDSGAAGNTLYFAMPYVQGESLRDRLTREKQLPLDEALQIGHEVADALTYAHAHDVVHRDIKPENILLESGHAVVADFGIARAITTVGGEQLTQTGLAVGTPAYMCPEQTAGDRALDGRADEYSLACVVYEMLGGAPPFTGPTPQAVMARHAVDPMPSLCTIRPALPPEVDQVLAKALAKVPADRYATPVEFVEALHGAIQADTGLLRPARMLVRRWRTRSRTVRAVSAVAALGVLALAGTWGWRTLNGGSRITSLAVLPFDNLSGDTAEAYFVAGMHDALEGAIGQVGSIRVIGRSVRRYARAPKPIPDIARELNVDGVVTAGVTRSGDAVTLQVRLIRARPAEELLWAQDYNRHVRDVIAMHREVARTIAREARASVSADQESRLADAHPVNPRTYEAYLRGMALLNRSTQAEHQRGIAILEQVIAEDPGDALAYAGLSLGYATMGHGADPPPDAWQRARQTALRAVGLDPELAEAHAALADVKLYYEHDYAGAEREFRRANELNPSLAMNHYHYAWYLELMRRRDEAIEEHTRAQELDPLTPLHTAWLGALYYGKGRTDQGMAEAKKVLARDSMNALGLQILAEGYSRKRMHDSAIAIFQRAVSVSPASRWNLATAYIMAGRLDEARKIVAVLDSLPTNAFRAWNRALLHAQLGELDEAYRWAMYEPSHAWLPWFRTMDFMAAFRADPRYPEFLRRVKLPD